MKTIAVKSISIQYFEGLIHISFKMFHLPSISTKFQKIITVGMEYFIAYDSLLILMSFKNRYNDQNSEPKAITYVRTLCAPKKFLSKAKSNNK